MFVRIRPVFVLIGVALFLTSCARFCGQMAYRNVIDEETSRFVYEGTTAREIWSETRVLLEDYGYAISDKTAAPVEETYRTSWVGEPGARDRLSVRITRAGRMGHRLQIHKVIEYEEEIYPPGYDPYDPNARPLDPSEIRTEVRTRRERQLQMEWALVQNIDPEAALLIEGAALRRQEMTQEVVANGCQ